MNERKMAGIVLTFLIALNVILLGYQLYQKRQESWVPQERIEQVRQLYEQAGIQLDAQPEPTHLPQTLLALTEADLDTMVERYMGEHFDKSYIYGTKVQYTRETERLVTDRSAHTITYENSNETLAQSWQNVAQQNISEEEETLALLPQAQDFARRWLGEEIYLIESERRENGFRFLFYEMQDGRLYAFNRAELTVTPAGVQHAAITYWQAEEKSEKTYQCMPSDEMLYAFLAQIKHDRVGGRVTEILAGYQEQQVEEKTIGVPAMTIVLDNGVSYQMPCLSIEGIEIE